MSEADKDIWTSLDGFYFDRQGKEINLQEWSALKCDPAYTRINSARLHGVRVSTVWLGLDYGIEEKEIFETMVFARRSKDKNQPWHQWMNRYSSQEEATLGHYRMVDWIRTKGLGIFSKWSEPDIYSVFGIPRPRRNNRYLRKQNRDRTNVWRPIGDRRGI